MIIKNGNVFTEEGVFEQRDLYIEGNYIVAQSLDKEIIDAKGLYVIPGLIDTHIHGACGYDFCDGTVAALENIGAYLVTQGITAYMPTSMSLSKERLGKVFKCFAQYYKEYDIQNKVAIPLGIHMEGPFFEDAKKGAQSSEFLCGADLKIFQGLQICAGGHIKIVSLSPVVDNALQFIKELKDKVILSLGHTTADYELASHAFEIGASRVTHLYNGMLSMNHRAPGVIGAAFDDKDVYVELIGDGIHVHPSVIRSSFTMYTDERIVLISDNIRAVGMSDGIYELGGQTVKVELQKATLEDGTIAGSATNLMACMKKLVEIGIPLTSAIKVATMNPAKSVGVYNQMGSLSVGKLANIVLLDQDLNIQDVYIQGNKVNLSNIK